jgi:hypothetical protein
MAADQNIPLDANMLIAPAEPTPGALGTFAKYGRLEEVRRLQAERQLRVWEVRALISDHIPLAGDAAAALSRPSYAQLRLNENPLWIYLHSGGRRAVYYGLFADGTGALTHISVNVQSRLPSNALLLARRPINALLDVLSRDWNMPLLIQRLELMSPLDGETLLCELLIPERQGIALGPLGGIIQAVPFAPYDALYREALTTASPFYRLLCAWKMHEGINRIRRWTRNELRRRHIADRMPPDPEVDQQELIRLGFRPEFIKNVHRVGDLFARLKGMRDAIAHFLIETKQGESHVYLADGAELLAYATGSAALLRYAHRVLEELRQFCVGRIPLEGGGPAILPMPANRDQFIVRAEDFGLE